MPSVGARLVAVGLLVLLVILAATAAFVPVTLTASSGVSGESVAAGLWERQAQPAMTRITLRAQGTVRFNPPALTWPQRFQTTLIEERGAFQFDEQSGQFVAEAGKPMILRGYLADFTLVLAAGSTGSLQLRRISDGQRTSARATPSDPVAALPSPDARYRRTTSFAWRTIPAGLADPATADLSARIGAEELSLAGLNEVPLGRAIGPASLRAITGWAVVLLAGAVLLVCWLLGRAMDPDDSSAAPRQAGRMAVGFGSAAVLMNSLSYWIPAGLAAWIVLSAAAAFVIWRLARMPSGASRLAGLGAVGRLLGLTAIPAAVMFFPTLLWGLQYAGEYKTDLFEYMNLASIVRDHPLLSMQALPEAQAAGTLTSGAGVTWRSVDSVVASGLSAIFPIPTVGAFALLGPVLFGLYATALLGLRHRNPAGRVGDAITLLALLAPAFVGLYVENYLSHYFFIALVPAVVLLLALRLDAWPSREPYLTVSLGITVAVLGAAYPYFLVVLAVGLAAAFVTSRERIPAVIRVGPAVLLTALVSMNLALMTVVNYSRTEIYQQALNGIARFVLLAPYSPAQQIFLAGGFVPYQWRGWPVGAAPYMGTPGGQVWSLADWSSNSAWLYTVLLIVFLTSVLAALAWRRSLRDVAFAASVGVLLVWTAFAVAQMTQAAPYVALKSAWTAVAFAPLILSSAMWRPRGRWFVLIMISLMTVIWLRTDAADRVNWLVPGSTALEANSPTTIVEDITGASAQMEGAESMAMFAGEGPLAGSDLDRIAAAHMRTAARDLGIECPNCDSGAANLEQITCNGLGDVVILVGPSNRSVVCGKERVFDGSIVEVYR